MKPVNQLFTIPNNEEGQLFLALANKYLNAKSYSLWARGRTPNHTKMKKAKVNPCFHRQSLPLKYADNMGVYLMVKLDKKRQVVGINDAIYLNKLRKEFWEAYRKNEASKSLLDALNQIDVITAVARQTFRERRGE